jgi:protein-tyrosine phosphatase
MIDLHCHVLPGVDDGAASIDVSRRMLERARNMGFSSIVATPHLTGPLDDRYHQLITFARDWILPLADEAGVTLVPGFEIRLTPDLADRLRAGECSMLGSSRTVLVDLACIELPHFVDDALFSIQTAGFQPILAHPERYPAIQRGPELGVAFAERGIALQVTIGSLAGAFGKLARKTAEELLKLGAVHLVATDAHSDGQRMQAVPEGLARLRKLLGPEEYRRATFDNPAALLGGSLPEPLAALQQGFWSRLPLPR